MRSPEHLSPEHVVARLDQALAALPASRSVLAQRSADAAKEIKGLISKSTEEVKSGVILADDTGAALERIMTRVSEIDQLVNDIATAVDEQSRGVREINAAVGQIDRSTQENPAA